MSTPGDAASVSVTPPEPVWMHPRLARPDLDAYLADAIRSDAMLALVGQAGWRSVTGIFYRGRMAREPEPAGLVVSWANSPIVARSFGQHVRAVDRLALVAVVRHREPNGAEWFEYVGKPAPKRVNHAKRGGVG